LACIHSPLKTVNDPDYKRFLVALRQAREDAGLNQEDLAKRLGKHQTFVSKIETAQRTLDLLDFLRWARETDSDPLEMMRGLADKVLTRKREFVPARKRVKLIDGI
jgi:transcriptional regulator with XRE-family HTH domain